MLKDVLLVDEFVTMLLEEFVVIEALEFVVTILSLEDIELWLEEFELVIGDDALLVVIDEVGV